MHRDLQNDGEKTGELLTTEEKKALAEPQTDSEVSSWRAIRQQTAHTRLPPKTTKNEFTASFSNGFRND